MTDATGRATHLGRVRLHETHCPAEPNIVLDGWMTITAANGDTLVGRYDYDPASSHRAAPGLGSAAPPAGEPFSRQCRRRIALLP